VANVSFGLVLTAKGLPVNELLEYNRSSIRTLSSAFTTLWLEDHFQYKEGASLECLSTLSFLAAEFPSLQIGSLVLCQSHRNPALVAKVATNLQFLSQGRLILGLGAGWDEDEHAAYGYPFASAKIRLEQLEEAILIIRSMWTSRPASFTGKYYQIRAAYCDPQPSPPIPLLIGGGGEQRTLALVARYADWWNVNACTAEQYACKLAVLQEHCHRVGRDFAEIRLTYSTGTIGIGEDPVQVTQRPQKHTIAGNSAEVIQKLECYYELGVTHFMVKFAGLAALKRFIATVVPHFSGYSSTT
jgi:alkanesulfonate monooxygenase SsuD/methylene tetrahydromethanopterin reductase-like flavin-dependent oxidoreductase (luciferase family)